MRSRSVRIRLVGCFENVDDVFFTPLDRVADGVAVLEGKFSH